MGKKYNGGIPTPTSISVNKAEPSNDREIVENLSDLLTLEFAYPLMKVVVEEDGNTYQWVGGAQNDLSNWVDEVTIIKNGLSAITKGEGLVFETRAAAIAAPITPDELDPFTVYNESGFNGQYAFTSGNADGYILISLFVNEAEVGDSMEGSNKYFDGDKTIDRIREELFDSEPTENSTNTVESGGVYDSLEFKAESQIGKNLFNIDNKIDNYYVKHQDGTLTSNNSYIVVTVSNLLPSTNYIYSNQGAINPSGVSTLQQMAFFDINGNYVSGDVGGVNEVSFNTSSNIVTAKFTISKNYLDYQYQLEVGTSRGYYEEYSKNINNSTLDESLQKTLRNYTKEVITFSSSDYTKNYTNLRTALESCTDVSKEYEVWVYSSVSNVLTEYFTEAEINDSLFKGLDIPNNVTLLNPILTNEITLGGSLDLATYNSTTRNRVSTLNFIYNGGLKGIKVTAENIRYAVHDDIASDKVDAIRVVDNCEFRKIGTEGFTQAYGAGTRSGMQFLMKNSKCFTDDEGASFSNHNNTSFTAPCKIVLENNHFESVKGFNSVAFGSLGSGQDDIIEMRGNFFNNGIRLYEEGLTSGIDFKLSGFGNSKLPVYIEQTDSVQYTYSFNEDVEIYRNRAGSTITRGKLVRLNTSGTGGIFAMSSSYPNQEYGIAFEDISTLELGKIKPFKSGQWIAISDTDLSGTSIGDKIGISTNGTLEITTNSEYIGVVLLNNFIKLK